jgi:hypothetical protein
LRSKIFLSSGEREGEMQAVKQIEKMLIAQPYEFDVHVAKNHQSIFEINSGIIGELKNSDYFLFINFLRGKLGSEVLGSQYSNQEFAIAYALGFERLLVVNQKGASREGILPYFGCNTDEFDGYQDCRAVVKRAWDRTGWLSGYSRRLRTGAIRFSEPIVYGGLAGTMLSLDIHNGRSDFAALEATARLVRYKATGSAAWTLCAICSVLKATGRPGFSHTIFPQSHEAFDLLCVGTSQTAAPPEHQQIHVYLNSALDRIPTESLPFTFGTWELEYQFLAIGFPLLTAIVELAWPPNGFPSARVLSEECS